MPPVTLRQRRRALQRGSTFPPIGLTSALDRPGPLGCWSHADYGGYGKCVNGKCQYPIANPSQAACRTDADCNVFEMCSWGVCVEASPGITAHPTQREAWRKPKNRLPPGFTSQLHTSSPVRGPTTLRQLRKAHQAALRNPPPAWVQPI